MADSGYPVRIPTDQSYLLGMMRLVEVVHELARARDLATIAHMVRSAARDLLDSDGSSFAVRNGDRCLYSEEEEPASLRKSRWLPLDRCISGLAMLNRRSVVVQDLTKERLLPTESSQSTLIKGLLVVPIGKTEPVGAVGSYWAHPHNPAAWEIDLLQALADSAAVAIELVTLIADLEDRVKTRTHDLAVAVEEARHLALFDELTGLYNRRGFFVMAEQTRKLARRLGIPGFLAYVDADGLKEVNDRLGHGAGDEVLRQLGEVLKSTLRQTDIIARVGGDEFCVFGLNKEGDLSRIRKRIDQNIRKFNSEHAGWPFKLSASTGMWSCGQHDTTALTSLVKQADEAMYELKRKRKTRQRQRKFVQADASTRS